MATKPPCINAHGRSTGWRAYLLVMACLACLVLLAYGPCLDNHFWTIDDQRHVANGAGEPFPNHYFRPGQALSFQLLWNVAGTDPFPYYLLGLIFHWLSACLLFGVARRFLGGVLPALVAAAVFATLFAPHQAVCWIGAHLGVQSVAFALAALLCWQVYLEKDRLLAWAAALAAAGAALCFKETGLNLLLWMLVVHLLILEPRDLLKTRRLLAWLPFGVLAILVCWRALTVPGGVGMEAEYRGFFALTGRLLRSVGQLPLPLEFEPWRYYPWIYFLAGLVLTVPVAGSYLLRRHEPDRTVPRACRPATAWAAVALVVCGHGANLPGEPEIIGERFYYDAAPGFALLLSILFMQLRTLFPQSKGGRGLAWALLLIWISVQVAAIHGVESRKYDAPSRHVEALERSTRQVIAAAAPVERLVFLSPPLPDLDDFTCILRIWLGVDGREIQISPGFLPTDPAFRERLDRAQNEAVYRWDEVEEEWIDFNPGADAWLDGYAVRYWPGGLKDPNLPKTIRFVTVSRRGGEPVSGGQ